jgi:hypothetical protein
MRADERNQRLRELGAQAEAALDAGDDWGANELLRQYRLVDDGGRDPEALLAEGMSLTRMATALASPDEDLNQT